MKKIFSYIVLSFIICFSGFSSVSAVSITVGNNNSVFTTNDDKIPYCPPGSDCGFEKGISEVKGKVNSIETEGTAVDYIQKVVVYILGFLFAITVIIIIWAGFMILTAAGNDDKIESAKKIIKNCVIGLIVIFLAYPITNFIVSVFDKSKTNTTNSIKP